MSINICEACLEDFKKSPGAQSKTGEELITAAEGLGFKFNIVPPDKCEDSAHSLVMKDQEEREKKQEVQP